MSACKDCGKEACITCRPDTYAVCAHKYCVRCVDRHLSDSRFNCTVCGEHSCERYECFRCNATMCHKHRFEKCLKCAGFVPQQKTIKYCWMCHKMVTSAPRRVFRCAGKDCNYNITRKMCDDCEDGLDEIGKLEWTIGKGYLCDRCRNEESCVGSNAEDGDVVEDGEVDMELRVPDSSSA